VSEFQLLKRLHQQGVPPFDGADLGDPNRLYRIHFLLFHCLYVLQSRLWSQGEGLEIHCLRIAITAAGASDGGLASPDPMRGFYLDPANLDRQDVLELLGQFWRRFGANSQRREALRTLQLEDPVEPAQIRLQYRRLVMRHHPDRGGDTARLQELNAAMAALKLD
jgi:DnaJ-domain-containing protein 1